MELYRAVQHCVLECRRKTMSCQLIIAIMHYWLSEPLPTPRLVHYKR